MRTYVLYAIAVGLALYAWRDWFRALCGLIVLTAIIEHPDMPKSIAGLQGLNLWNVVLFSVFTAWLVQRRREGLQWDLPRAVSVLLLLYALVVLIGFGRMLADREHIEHLSTASLVSEYLVNALKWVVPGLLLFDGCRTRPRLALATGCTLALYLLLTIQVVRCTSLSALRGEGDLRASRERIQKRTGYNAVDLAALLAGASWGALAMTPVLQRQWQRGFLVASAVGIVVAQGLTGGRAGYLAWGVVGLTMGCLRWRRYLPLAPAVAVLLILAFPGAVARVLEGFGETGLSGETVADQYRVTSGRAVVWPYVLERVEQAPLFGYGQLAMIRTGLRTCLPEVEANTFAHPHNAYLEMLLDSGVAGLAIVLVFYGTIVVVAGRLFCDRSHPWCSAVGGLALALVLAQLVASIGSQHFYPREGVVGMWAAIGLMLRLWVLRLRLKHRRQEKTTASPSATPVCRAQPVAIGR